MLSSPIKHSPRITSCPSSWRLSPKEQRLLREQDPSVSYKTQTFGIVRLCYFFSFFFPLISLKADGPHHYHPACGHYKDLPISPRSTPYDFLSRCKFSTLTTRQPMVEFYLLTFPRFPVRKKEHKSYFGKNRTHDFHTSRCAGYLLDHLGDYNFFKIGIPYLSMKKDGLAM